MFQMELIDGHSYNMKEQWLLLYGYHITAH